MHTSINWLQLMVRSRRCEDKRRARYRTGDWNEFQHAGSNKVYICGFTLQTGSWKPSLTASSKNLLTSDGYFLRFCHNLSVPAITGDLRVIPSFAETKLQSHWQPRTSDLNLKAWVPVLHGTWHGQWGWGVWGGGQRGWGCPAKPADGRQKEQHFVAPCAHI